MDKNPPMKNVAYKSSLTASTFHHCKVTEETATHFLFDVPSTNRPEKNLTCITYDTVEI